MGGFLTKTFPSVFGESNLNPKLRPPSLAGVLLSLIITFCFIIWICSFRLGVANLFYCFAVCLFFGSLGVREGSAWERRYPSIVFLIPIAVISAGAAVYIGTKINVRIYQPYFLAMSGREYSDVPPSARTAEFADAGIINFNDDATLDTSRSFGFKAADFTYCVAPVVSREAEVHPASSGPKITFWAVGKDCCGSRREFECDGAGETEVKSAFAVKEVSPTLLTNLLVPRTSRPQYLTAVKAAKAIHNLRSEDDSQVILLRWATDPKDTLEVWNNRAKIAVVVSCIMYAIIVSLIWTIIHFSVDRQIRRLSALSAADASRSAVFEEAKTPAHPSFSLGSVI